MKGRPFRAVVVAALWWLLPAVAHAAQGPAVRGAAAQVPVAQPSRPGVERLEQLVQQRLQLTDAQAAQLRDVSGRYAGRRQALLAREREARRALRAEVQRGEGADQARVQASLDALLDVQQQRTGLVAEEQRELAGFLTPTQRAQFLGMQERAFRAAQQIRRQREAAAFGGPAGAPDRAAERALRQQARQAERAARQQEQAQRRPRAPNAARPPRR